MTHSYLLSAWRQLLRQRTHALTNLLGLTIGLTAGILISSYIRHELQYDRHHPPGNKLFRVNAKFIGHNRLKSD